jgi:hypothetical protein
MPRSPGGQPNEEAMRNEGVAKAIPIENVKGNMNTAW